MPSYFTIALLAFTLAVPFSLWFYGKFLAAFARGETRTRIADFESGDLLMAIVFILGFIGIIAMALTSREAHPPSLQNIILGSTIYVSIAILLLGMSIFKVNPLDLYGLRQFRPLQAFLWMLAALPILYLSQEVSRHLFENKPQEIITFLLSHRDPLTLITLGVMTVVVAPAVEEFIFRGFLYGVCSRYFGRCAGLIFTASLFAAVHLNLMAAAPLFLLAVCLTLAYERTGSLWTPIVMHASFNALAFSMLVCFPQFVQ